jgi:predicted aldo/keto reductase-like oxidoreductase
VDSLSEKDRAFVRELKKAYLERIAIGCTRCDYCQPCPEGVLIPRMFAAVNDAYMFEDDARFNSAYREILRLDGGADRCVACGQCEDACPQHLPIIRLLEEVQARV